MVDKNLGFLEVLQRLKMALDCSDDVQVAARLGISKTAFNNRKLRGSLPVEAIDALIQDEGLNPEFIYQGIGSVHLDIDGESWQAGFNKRLAQSLGMETYLGILVREGYKANQLKEVAKGLREPSPQMLRDMRRCLQLDLNWLVCGDSDAALTPYERSLLVGYRKADAPQQQAVGLMLSAFAPPAPRPAKTQQKAGKQSIQITGPIESGATLNTGNISHHAARKSSPAKKR